MPSILERNTRKSPDPESVLGALAEVAFAPGSDEKDAPVKLSSKLKALELLGKTMGLFDGNPGKSLPTVQILEDIQ